MDHAKRNPLRLIGIGAIVLAAIIVAGCTPDNPQSTFGTSGPVARSQLVLFYWIFWAAVFVFVVVGGAFLYVIFRYRKREGDPDPPQIHGHRNIEIAWTILPSVVLAVVAVPTVTTIFDNAAFQPEGMVVKVVAHQWWWEFRYSDPADPTKEIVTANELHIPVGEPVNIALESVDVLHSFWIPKIAGKVDVVPNNANTMWIEADEAGEYRGVCAEFCGVAHALMRFRVIAEPKDQFDNWLLALKAPGEDDPDPLAQEGRALFEGNQAQCWACHTVMGSDRARGTKGPNLTHVASRSYIGAALMSNTQAHLREWLANPQKMKEGNMMARDAAVYNDDSKKLNEAQISALVAYLMSLK